MSRYVRTSCKSFAESLNPYSNGIYSLRSIRELANVEVIRVLILILMEYTL